MGDPTIICPNCCTEIKLTESLSAPLIQATREQYEAKIAQKEADISKREAAVKAHFRTIEAAKRSIDEQIAERLHAERIAIAASEFRKAKTAVGADLAEKSRELEELHALLAQRDHKLKEAQEAQTGTLRKQRELDDAMREVNLTIERRVAEAAEQIREKKRPSLRWRIG